MTCPCHFPSKPGESPERSWQLTCPPVTSSVTQIPGLAGKTKLPLHMVVGTRACLVHGANKSSDPYPIAMHCTFAPSSTTHLITKNCQSYTGRFNYLTMMTTSSSPMGLIIGSLVMPSVRSESTPFPTKLAIAHQLHPKSKQCINEVVVLCLAYACRAYSPFPWQSFVQVLVPQDG